MGTICKKISWMLESLQLIHYYLYCDHTFGAEISRTDIHIVDLPKNLFGGSIFYMNLVWTVKIKAPKTSSLSPHCCVCSNGFYAVISSQHQLQQYKSCHFNKILVILKYRWRLWANIFDTDISRCINIPKKAKYTV